MKIESKKITIKDLYKVYIDKHEEGIFSYIVN